MTTSAKAALAELGKAYNLLCPSNDIDAIANLERELLRDGADYLTICRHATSMLYDGLAYGNWPSVTAKL